MLYLNRDIIKRIPFLRKKDPGFVSYCASLMQPTFTMAGDNIFSEGQLGNEM